MKTRQIIVFILLVCLAGCGNPPAETLPTSTPTEVAQAGPLTDTPTKSPSPTATHPQTSPTSELTRYEFPTSIDPARRYMFYVHGKIIEDQGLPAVSPEFGEYEYLAILERLASYDFVVISEQRTKDANSWVYAQRVVAQIELLLAAGVQPGHITVVGASKGAYIAVFVSHQLKNSGVNFVLLGTCHPDTIREWQQNQLSLRGNILAISDSVDEYAGSCEDMFASSVGQELGRHDEVILHLGNGHGLLYQPLDEWILPTVEWAQGQP